jgi:outer membrane protein TolC
LWNLYTGGRDRAQFKQEELNLMSISEGIIHLEGQLELDATTAWNRVVAARSSADSARATLDLAAEAHRAAAVGYSAGVTPYIDYLDALDKNVAAAIGYLLSLAEVKMAQANLVRAMGFPYGYPNDPRAHSSSDTNIYETLGLTEPTEVLPAVP